MHEPFRRVRPPLVRQTSNMSCWAAALVSWLGVCCPRARLDETAIADAFRRWQTPDGRIELPGLQAIAEAFTMGADEVPGANLTPEYLAAKLRFGHLYLTYTPGPAPDIGHTVVVYTVGPVVVDLMDPFVGYTSQPFAFFTSRRRAFVAWPRYGGGVVPLPE